jgi:hypothetical protein
MLLPQHRREVAQEVHFSFEGSSIGSGRYLFSIWNEVQGIHPKDKDMTRSTGGAKLKPTLELLRRRRDAEDERDFRFFT